MLITIQISGKVGERKSTVLKELIKFLFTIGTINEINNDLLDPHYRQITFSYKEATEAK